jgi:hypothetical protein
MKLSDRRLAQRFSLTIPLYIRAWNSHAPEQRVESVNVSECGAYFETDKPPTKRRRHDADQAGNAEGSHRQPYG